MTILLRIIAIAALSPTPQVAWHAAEPAWKLIFDHVQLTTITIESPKP